MIKQIFGVYNFIKERNEEIVEYICENNIDTEYPFFSLYMADFIYATNEHLVFGIKPVLYAGEPYTEYKIPIKYYSEEAWKDFLKTDWCKTVKRWEQEELIKKNERYDQYLKLREEFEKS